MSKRSKPDEKGPDELSLGAPDPILTDMDPHLQKLRLAQMEGETMDESLVRVDNEGNTTVDVIARLKNPSEPVPGLTIVREMAEFVTGTADLSRIEEVRKHPNVLVLKLAQPIHPQLQFSVPEIHADAGSLRTGHPGIDGRGVIVGIVDYGFDFAHRNFRRADDSTRLIALWDQRGGPTPASPPEFGYGREFTPGTINGALATADPYATLDYSPGDASHGTHVADIAAGNGRATGFPGVAPSADYIFVNLGPLDFSDEENFGNSRRLLEAVDYIFTRAGSRPVVVNLSLGTQGGPHDGSTPAEREFDAQLRVPGRAIVISAGNAFGDGGHSSGTIGPGASHSVEWQIAASDLTGNEVEVWYPGNAELEIKLVDPSGTVLGPVRAGTTQPILLRGARAGVIIHRRRDSLNNDNHIDILLGPSLRRGRWLIELVNRGQSAGSFHAWIERDDAGPSRFGLADRDTSRTLGSISCGRETIVVGSYSANTPGRDISVFSAAGPTRDGREKPEISAPGDAVLAARSLSATRRVAKSGTSMAAPHVTGCIALLMQAAGRPLSIAEIRQAVANSGRRQSSGISWDPRFGRGRIDVLHLLQPSTRPIGSPAPALIERPAMESLSAGMEPLCKAVGAAAAETGTWIRLQIESAPHAVGGQASRAMSRPLSVGFGEFPDRMRPAQALDVLIDCIPVAGGKPDSFAFQTLKERDINTDGRIFNLIQAICGNAQFGVRRFGFTFDPNFLAGIDPDSLVGDIADIVEQNSVRRLA